VLLSYCLSSPVQYLYSNVWKQQRTQVIARAEAYPLKSTGNIWRFALRLAGAAGARKHSCRSVREPRELPPFVSLVPSHTRRCTWRFPECLANLESASQNIPIFNIFKYSIARMPYAFQLE